MEHILEIIKAFDRQAFFAINHGLACPALDFLMPIIRYQWTWLPVYAFFAWYLVYKYKVKGLFIILFAFLTLAISDQLNSHVLKYLVQRPRPCNDSQIGYMVRNLIPCGSGYSFPSSHATNHFAFSLFLISVRPRNAKWIIPFALIWAALVCLAQVYVGVHYPVDVTCGAILGTGIGLFTGWLCRRVVKFRKLN